MLPPDHSVTAGTRAGPACPCTLKPLPCLVDNWVTGHSVPYEQPLSIQTDMEYTLDTRMFPGWDPVTGHTQPALVVDTAVLTARSQAAAAPATRARGSQSQRAALRPTRYRTATGTWSTRTPASPADLPPAAPYHPAFRPVDPQFRQSQQFRHHRPLQQDTTLLPQTADTDLLALIASIDVEPAGYTLDVDWLIGHPHQAVPPASAAYSAAQRNAAAQRHLPPHPAHQGAPPGAPQMTFTPDLTDYQSQFYPGASWGVSGIVGISGAGGGIIGTSGSGLTTTSGPAAAVVGGCGFLQAPPGVSINKPRATKRRLPVDSPCEGSLPVAFIDLTGPTTKRARYAGGEWATGEWAGGYGLGMTPHVPSPLQNRAY